MSKVKPVPAVNIPLVRLLTTTAEVLSEFQAWCRRAEEIRVVSAWATGQCQAFADLINP